MKHFLLPFLLAAVLNSWSQDTMFYVAAKTGLNIREKPELNSKLIEKIPYGTRVSLLQAGESMGRIRIENMSGYWKKVSYNHKTGFIIDVYLLPVAPPVAGIKTLKEYLTQVSAPFGEKLIIRKGDGNDAEAGASSLTKQLYKNGGECHEYIGYEYNSMTYFLPGLTMQQAFLLVRLLPEFADYIHEKDEFILDGRKLKKRGREYEYKVDKEVFGDTPWVNRIRIDFEEGAIYHFEMYQIDDQVIIFYGSGV